MLTPCIASDEDQIGSICTINCQFTKSTRSLYMTSNKWHDSVTFYVEDGISSFVSFSESFVNAEKKAQLFKTSKQHLLHSGGPSTCTKRQTVKSEVFFFFQSGQWSFTNKQEKNYKQFHKKMAELLLSDNFCWLTVEVAVTFDFLRIAVSCQNPVVFSKHPV